jgi:pimeloyl-ACP methyl ester carboxylesterase
VSAKRSLPVRLARGAAFTAIGLYAAVVLAYGVLQGMFIFPAPRTVDRTPADVGLAFEEASIATEDGETLHGYWMPAEEPRGTWLYFHGNGSSVAGTVDFAKLLRDRGWSVLVLDYRGYGKSTGSPSEWGLAHDARAAWRYLTDSKGIPPESIVIHGRSLGGGVAVTLASEVDAAALIVESSFTSIADVARLTYWWLPIDLLLRHRFDSESRMPAVHEPILVLHSHGDARIPFSHAERLVAATPRDTTHAGAVLMELQGDHNETIQATGANRYTRMLDDFASRHVKAKQAEKQSGSQQP